MSRVRELLERERPRPAFDILRAAHAELLVTDLDAAERVLRRAARPGRHGAHRRALYLRGWEERLHHSLVLRQAPTGRRPHRVPRARGRGPDGARRRSPRSAATAGGRRASAAKGRACACWTRSASRSSSSARWTSSSRARSVRPPARRAGDALRPRQPARDERRDARSSTGSGLGFRCSEYISTDGARGAAHRRLGAAQVDRPRPRDDRRPRAAPAPRRPLGRRADGRDARLRPARVGRPRRLHRARPGPPRRLQRVLRLPARPRRPPRRALRLRLLHGRPRPPADPLEHDDPRCRSFWGARAPDSWYEESSTLLGLDGRPVPVADADVEERSHLMA